MSETQTAEAAPYRASVIKRKRSPAAAPSQRTHLTVEAPPPSGTTASADPARERAARVQAEREAIARIDRMTLAWNDELAASAPALGAIVSRTVRQLVGEAPREGAVMSAVERELSRFRGEHRPVLRVGARGGQDRAAWVDRLRRLGGDGRTAFDVVVDESVGENSCVLELGSRRVELSPETQLTALDTVLRRTVGSMAPVARPELPDVDVGEVLVEDAGEPDVSATMPDRRSERVAARPRVRVRARSAGDATPSVDAPPSVDVPPSVDAGPAPSEPEASLPEERSVTDESPEAHVDVEATDVPRTPSTEPSHPAPSVPARTLDGFDDLDLGADAARFEATPGPDAEPPRRTHGETMELRPATEPTGSRAVADLRERVVRTSATLRQGAKLDGRESVPPVVPMPSAEAQLPPFAYSTGRNDAAPRPEPEPGDRAAGSDGDLVRRALRGEKPLGPLASSNPEPVDSALPEARRSGTEIEPDARGRCALRLPPRIARLIDEVRGS